MLICLSIIMFGAKRGSQGSFFKGRAELRKELGDLPIRREDYGKIEKWNLNESQLSDFKLFALKVHKHLLHNPTLATLDDLKKSYPLNPLLQIPKFLTVERYNESFDLFKAFHEKKEEYLSDVAYFDNKFDLIQGHFNSLFNNSNFAGELQKKYPHAFDYFFINQKGIFKSGRLGFKKPIILGGKIGELSFYSNIKGLEWSKIEKLKGARLNEENIKKTMAKMERILVA